MKILSLFNRSAAQDTPPPLASSPAADRYMAATGSKPAWVTGAQAPLLPPERNGQPALGGRFNSEEWTFCVCCCCADARPGVFNLSSSYIPIICCDFNDPE